MQPGNTLNHTSLRRLLFAALALCVLMVAVIIYQSVQFHIVGTTPAMDSFPSGTPILLIDFNKPLANTTLNITWNPGVASTYAISGQRLTINLQSTLATNQQYTITIKGVRSQAADSLGNITYTFTTQDITYNNMPKDIQQALLKQQDQAPPPSRNTITFDGTSGLLSQGISSYQIEAIKQAVFLFGQSTRTTIATAIIDDNTISIPPYSNQDVPDYFTMTFDITINGTKYHATLLYNDSSSARVQLAANGAQVYDSGVITGTTL